jgi:FKBP-type peptidyl-prolyl cis-trans isomerase
MAFTACGGAEAPVASPPPAAYSQIDLATGDGRTARRGARLTVHYTAVAMRFQPFRSQRKQFDSSIDREPFTFRLGAGEVIAGWDRGFDDMRVGGKRRLIVPPDLGYGATGMPAAGIPGNAGLVFEMELLMHAEGVGAPVHRAVGAIV